MNQTQSLKTILSISLWSENLVDTGNRLNYSEKKV